MEEEAQSRRSVAELAGRFKVSTRPHDAAGNETEKPVRRRPPRSLQLPKTHGDDQEPPGVTSPLPAKAKRNSALIEKLQANLALSPSALLPSPKSPGFRVLPPAFTPPSPGSAPVSTVATPSTASPASPVVTAASPLTEEEGPASFEAPPTVVEGTILSNTNIKGRARHSIRRRPPSRRHRKSSCGDEVGVATEGGDVSLTSSTEPKDETTAGGGGGGGGGGGEEVSTEEGKTDEVMEDKTSTHPEKNESHEEDESKVGVEPRGEDEEKKEGSSGGEEGDRSSSGRKEEEEKEGSSGGEEGDGSSSGRKEEEETEKNSGEKEKDLIEGATNTESKDEQSEETTSPSSAR